MTSPENNSVRENRYVALIIALKEIATVGGRDNATIMTRLVPALENNPRAMPDCVSNYAARMTRMKDVLPRTRTESSNFSLRPMEVLIENFLNNYRSLY